MKNLTKTITYNYPRIDAILIGNHTDCLAALYFNDYAEDDLHEIQSVTKSLQSLLIGIAIDKGYIADIHAPIKPYFPEYAHLDWSNGKQDISVYHLLTMQAGIQWNEGEVSYSDILNNDASRQMRSDDIVDFALRQPMQYPRNDAFVYSSANPILLSKILKSATGLANQDFAYQHLYLPLGIEEYSYQVDKTDADITADLDMRPLDMLRIGQMLLRKGTWNGQPIIAEGWLRQSWQPVINISALPYLAQGYGYSWWLREFVVGNRSIAAVYAWGIGGQHIFVMPSLHLTVVFTGNHYRVRVPSEPFEVMQKWILPEFV